MQPDEVAFLVKKGLTPQQAASDLGYGFSSRDACGRGVRADPLTFDEAVSQLHHFQADADKMPKTGRDKDFADENQEENEDEVRTFLNYCIKRV